MSYTQRGDRPRVMTPVELVAATAKAKTALWAYIGIARFADNQTGRSSCTVEQVADAVGIGRSQVSVGINWLLAHGWVTRLVAGRKGSGASLYEVRMEPAAEAQHPTFRTLTSGSGKSGAEGSGSGFPAAGDPSASDFPDADAPSASEEPDAEQPSASGNPDPETESASGKPDSSIRFSGRFLVSSLVSKEPPYPPQGETEHADELSLGVEAPSKPPKRKPKRTANDYPPEFVEFWQAAPRRRGTERGSKPEALKEWRAALARGIDNASLIAAAKAYGRTADPLYVKDTCRWLKGELYEPYLEQTQRHTAGEPTDAELDAVLGKALITLPAPPAGIDYGTAAHREWKAQFFRDHRAERIRAYYARTGTATSRSTA